MRDDLPTGTVTFLFTDVEGSTKLLHELGAEAYTEALADHRRVVREACAHHGGVEVDTQGDAFFFAFPSAPSALTAASELTERLAAGQVHVRVGVHTGTPFLGEEGYVGHDVHRAARIAAAGHGGQVLVSATTAALLAEDGLRDLGPHRFKDLAAPERVHQLGYTEFPPLKSLYRTNLPVPGTPFLGRKRELAEVAELLARDELRLLTLTGPGGTGKTRLALQAAGHASEQFVDGLIWVPLAALRDPALVLETVAQATEVSEHAGRSSLESLSAELTDKRMLILLDNAEHLMPTFAGDVAALVAAVPTLTVVVTSRERLRVDGERNYPVPPLGDIDGARLFSARARALDPTFSPTDAVKELCQRLDNLPLALELAAARTGLLSPDQLLERLAGRLDGLKGNRDVDPRQQTLRATISWSHDLLNLEEQKTLARMSVFAGGCTLEAAEAVCEQDLDILESLLDKSLVGRRDSVGGPRLWMLETIREFASEQLAASSSADEVARRHLGYYLLLAQEVAEHGKTGEYDLGRMEEERDNLRVALDTALALDPQRALEMVGVLGGYWTQRGDFREGRARLEAALAAAPDGSAAARALALRASGSLAIRQADFDEAERCGHEALVLFRAQHDRQGASSALNLLGAVATDRGDFTEATRLLEEALEESRVSAGEAERVMALSNLAGVADATGDSQRAIELGREIVMTTRGRDSWALAHALNNLGVALESIGETDEARQSFEEAIAVSRSHGLSQSLAYVLASLAHLELDARPSDAITYYRESLALMGSMGEQRGVAYCLEGLGAVSLRGDDAVLAATLFGAAAAIRERTSAALDSNEQAEVDAVIGQAKERLGTEGFSAAWSDGTALSIDRAVEIALS